MARIAAAKVLLDRGWGKASETHKIDINGETSLLKDSDLALQVKLGNPYG